MKDKQQLILDVSSTEDIEKLKENEDIKYININLTNPNNKVIDYLLTNGKDLLYSSIIDNKRGYIYIDYDTFRKGQILINNIISSIPNNLTPIEKARYLYIKLGKFIGYDINSIPNKNETYNLSTISTINNIWGSMAHGKGTNTSFTEIFYYLCRLVKIECKIAIINDFGYKKNIITIEKNQIITDITQDIPYIQSGFKTRFFAPYNDEDDLDKKINYIKDDYSEKKLEQALKKIDYKNDNFFMDILLKTQDIIHVENIQPIELGIIYNEIFNKYCPNYDISINNLYITNSKKKEHFILITYESHHYSYNYNKQTFVEISSEELSKNIDNKLIGVYYDENLPKININKLKVA